jgi:hypothetical protein
MEALAKAYAKVPCEPAETEEGQETDDLQAKA